MNISFITRYLCAKHLETDSICRDPFAGNNIENKLQKSKNDTLKTKAISTLHLVQMNTNEWKYIVY